MFDSIVEKRPKRRWIQWLLGGSLGVHASAVIVVLVVDDLRVTPVPSPTATITFFDFQAPAPLPPLAADSGPSRTKRNPEPAKHVVPPRRIAPEPIVPTLIPPERQRTEPEPEPPSAGDEEREEVGPGGPNGVPGGSPGGEPLVTTPPAPTPPPAAPVFQRSEIVRQHRLTGTEPQYPDEALQSEEEGVVVVRLLINEAGKVVEVAFQQTHPAFERAVREALASWRFRPQIVDGRPVSVSTVFRFRFALR